LLRRSAELEQEEQETGKERDSEWFHGSRAPLCVEINFDLQLADSSRNPSRVVVEITESFLGEPVCRVYLELIYLKNIQSRAGYKMVYTRETEWCAVL
jgi:hypothetical protein